MTWRPGRGLVLAAGLLAILSLSAFIHAAGAGAAAVAVLLLAVMTEFDRRHTVTMSESIDVQRLMPVIAGRGRTFEVMLTVSNAGRRSVRLELRDVVPEHCLPSFSVHPLSLTPGENAPVRMKCNIPVRGEHVFGPVWIRLMGPMNLIERQHAIDCPGTVRILPETFASTEELIKDTGAQLQLLDKITRTRQHGLGTEFESLSAYRDGDDPRRIDWRTTARMRQPIVRRFQVERHRDVMIVIDAGRLMGSDTEHGSKLDCAVDAALNLARVALQSGDRCGIAAYDSTVRGFLPPVTGIKSLGNIVQCVYDLQTRWQESDFTRIHAELQRRQTKRSLLVILSDISDAETSRLPCAALQSLSRRHLVLFVALKTPVLQQILRAPVRTLLDGAEKSVTFRLLRDRSRALHVLERSGVHVLDAEPREVTIPLINQFVDLRQRNLL